MLQECKILKEGRQYGKAKEKYEQFIRSEPKPRKEELFAAYHHLTQIYEEHRDHLGAAKIYLKMIDLDPKFQNGNLYLELGEHYQLAKNFKESIWAYDQFLKIQPNHPQCHFNRGKALLQESQYDEAFKSFQKATEIRPDYIRPYEEMVIILKGRKQYQKVLSACRKLLKYECDYHPIIYEEGYALLILKRFKEAAEAFKQCLEYNKCYVKGYIGSGEANIRLQRYQDAHQILNNCLMNTQSIIGYQQKQQVKLLIGITYLKLQKTTQAFKCFREAGALATNHLIELLESEGAKSLRKRQFSESLFFYQELLSRSKIQKHSVLNNMGLAYQNINDFPEAERCFNKVLNAEPKNQEALNNIGALYKVTGRINESEAIFKRLTEEFPENLNFTINNGKIHMEKHRYKAALEQFFKAEKMEKANDNYELYNDMSVGLEKEHRYEEALVYANKANKVINQKSPLILLNRANVYMKLQNLSSAKRDFQIAGEILRSLDKSFLKTYGISESNLKFMFNQLNRYAYLMQPINTLKKSIKNEIASNVQIQKQNDPKVFEKIEVVQRYILETIISIIVKPQEQCIKIAPKDNQQADKEILQMIFAIQKQMKQKKQEDGKKFSTINNKFSATDKKLQVIIKKVSLQSQQIKKIKNALKGLNYDKDLSKKLNLLKKTDRSLWLYGQHLYWTLKGYLDGYMLISTGVVCQGEKANQSSLNMVNKVVGSVNEVASGIPIVGQVLSCISLVCGLFAGIQDEKVIEKIAEVIKLNYNTMEELNRGINRAVLLFLNDENKINRIKKRQIFKPSRSLQATIIDTISDIKDWFKEKLAAFIIHTKGSQKCQGKVEEYELALIDVGSIIAVLLNFKSDKNKHYSGLNTAAKTVLDDQHQKVEKMIIQAYKREKQQIKASDNGICQIM